MSAIAGAASHRDARAGLGGLAATWIVAAAGLLTVVLFPPEALMLLSGERRGSDRDASEPESEDTQ